ncbi:MAG: autotransporter domain-containing protein [Desulfovibrio sp.]|uniref:autotransporter domain-containing protein n=1 Tax=Desulfovibrio sp. TaxID=885 RepID=UPI0025848BD6|nr:autotransporter domain-containing protein [Desulfovibrio sp.]MCD7984505.1 autotransporter domain-containing protein [Desulfovibrio sp.]
MLTKGAMGNLVNKYRAVLKKCGLLNVFGSLAVAGALVLGGAGSAGAAFDNENTDETVNTTQSLSTCGQAHNVTIESGGTLTVSSKDHHAYFNGTTTLQYGGTLTINTGPHGIMGGKGSGSNVPDPFTGAFEMAGGTLTITSSQMQMRDVTINDGTVNISGLINNGTSWDTGAMLGAVGGTFSLNGGTVTLGDHAQLFAPTFNLDGGEIDMAGSEAGKAAHVRAYGDNGSLNLNGTTINVNKNGVISAKNMNITDGELNVAQNANLTMGITKLATNQSLREALKSSTEATVTQTGGTVNVAGRMDLGGALNIEGGEFTVAQSGQVAILNDNKNSAINMRGGVLNVYGYADAAQLAITGGTTNIIGDPSKTWDQQGLGGYNERWDPAANNGIGGWVDADMPTTVSGPDTVVNIQNANLFGGMATTNDTGGLRITDGATVNLSGTGNSAGMLFASDGQALTITKGASVNVADGQGGVFQAKTVNITDGATVSTGGELLMVGGGLTKKHTISSTKNNASAAEAVVGNGGTLAVTGTGYVDLNKHRNSGQDVSSSIITFMEGSTFDVSAASVSNGNTAIRNAVDNAVKVADGAKLRISGAKAGERYAIADAAINQTGENKNGWRDANLLSSTSFLGFDFNPVTGEVTTRAKSAAEAMPALDSELGNLASGMYAAGRNDYFASEKGRRFLSRATDGNYMADAGQAAVTIESAARMAVIGAVPQMTMAAANAAGNAVTQRTGLAQPGGDAIQSMAADGSVQTGASAGDASKTGFAMWIMPLYQSANGWGLEGGNFNMDYSGGLGGVAIGADYTFDNAIRAGITFNIGGGYAEGSGDFNKTTNDMNFWGIGAYLGWAQNNFGLTADVNYTSTYNKLEQELPSGMQMRDLKSDVTAWAVSAGLRGEYRFETGVVDIIPHAGLRYMSLNTDEYDVKSEGTLLKGDAINQNIWTFPVGVAFSKRIETGNGWHVKPSLDLAVIPAAGDIKARGDVRFTGVSGTAELETQTMDYISYMGQAGLEFGNDSVSFGVNYNLQAGAHSTAHGVFGTFRYEF